MKSFLQIYLLLFLFFKPEILNAFPRIISLYAGHSDNIFALGGGESLIALSENHDDEFLPNLPRIKLKASPEKFLALKPDIIITRSLADRVNPNLSKVLREAGVKVFIIDPPDWSNFENYLITLANILEIKPDDALKKFSQIKNTLAAKIPVNHKNINVFVEATGRELHTCSPNSWAANLIQLAGGNNIAKNATPLHDKSNIAAFGVERVLKSHVDEKIDVYIIQNGAMNNSTPESFYKRSWSSALNGVKIVSVPEKFLSRPSLIGLEHGGAMLIKIFYDESESDF